MNLHSYILKDKIFIYLYKNDIERRRIKIRTSDTRVNTLNHLNYLLERQVYAYLQILDMIVETFLFILLMN